MRGTPDRPNPSGLDDALLEADHHVHEDADKELRDLLAKEGTDIGPASSWYSRYRITKKECSRYGYTQDCIRCTRLQLGDNSTSCNHSEACRKRFYHLMFDNKDERFMRAMRCSPEFANRTKTIAEHDSKGQNAACMPELVDDDDNEHDLVDEDVIPDDHPAALVNC